MATENKTKSSSRFTSNGMIQSVIGALLVALVTWVFSINTQVAVMAEQNRLHFKKEAHDNTRQDQITTLKGELRGHRSLPAHPEAAKALVEIGKDVAEQRADTKYILRTMEQVLLKLNQQRNQ